MEQSVDLRQYVSAVRKWLWLVVVVALLGGGASYFVSQQMPKVYQASTTLLVQQASPTQGTQYNDILTSDRLAQTYSQLLTKRPVLEGVIASLKLSTSPEQLAGQLSVKLIQNTQLIQVTASNGDPALARRVADEVAAVFIKQNKDAQLGTLANSQQELANQIDRLKNNIATTQAEIDRLKAASSPDTTISRLQSDLGQYQLTYSSLLKNYQDLQLAEMRASDTVRIAEPAAQPGAPSSPQVMRNTLLAALVGLMLAVGAAFLIEYLDDTLKTAEDVAQDLALPFLGSLLRIKPRETSNGALTSKADHRSPASEAYRVLRTNIQFSSLDTPVSTLLVTSAQPGEGKTTTAANLGIVMAQAGKKVILVDSDLRRPALHKAFGASNGYGFTNLLLQDQPDLSKAMLPTEVENLRLVPSGPVPPNPSEILSSQRMDGVVEYLKGQAEVIIFDSPPVLGMADAAVLATRVQGVVLVADYGKTRRQAAAKAIETLRRVGGHVLGVTINRLSTGAEGYYYYRRYYHGNGKHDKSADIETEKSVSGS